MSLGFTTVTVFLEVRRSWDDDVVRSACTVTSRNLCESWFTIWPVHWNVLPLPNTIPVLLRHRKFTPKNDDEGDSNQRMKNGFHYLRVVLKGQWNHSRNDVQLNLTTRCPPVVLFVLPGTVHSRYTAEESFGAGSAYSQASFILYVWNVPR